MLIPVIHNFKDITRGDTFGQYTEVDEVPHIIPIVIRLNVDLTGKEVYMKFKKKPPYITDPVSLALLDMSTENNKLEITDYPTGTVSIKTFRMLVDPGQYYYDFLVAAGEQDNIRYMTGSMKVIKNIATNE